MRWTREPMRSGGNFQDQRVARNYGPAKTRLPDSSEQNQLIIAVFDFAQRQHSAYLSQGFDNQHAGHDGRAGKVALKERLVDADLFDADNSFARHQLDDAINQEKRITVRQQFLNCLGVQNCFHGPRIKRRGDTVNYRIPASKL